MTVRSSPSDNSPAPLDPSEATLKALMVAGLEGNSRAYRALLSELRARLSGYFRRRLPSGSGDVEDLVQDTLLALHSRRETYDRTQPFTAWAYAIARYKLIDHYRRTGRRIHVPLEDAGVLFVEDESAAADARHDLERVLAQLPQRQRDLVRRVKLDEYSHAEAAAGSGMTEGAVKVSVHRSLKRLAMRLRGEGASDE